MPALRARLLCASSRLVRHARDRSQRLPRTCGRPLAAARPPFPSPAAQHCTLRTTAAPPRPGTASGVARAATPGGGSARPPAEDDEWVIVNFYHLAAVKDAAALTAEHRKWMEDNGRPIKGRIYVSPQGINAQFSGKYGPCKAYMDFVQQQPGFASVSWGWERVTGHMYPRLRLQTKPALVSMSGGTLQYELHDQAARCDHLEPEQWKSMIKLARTLKTKDQAGAAAAAPPSEVDVGALPEDIRERAARGDLRDIVVLDLRNDYEWDVGHFEGAERPRETEFRETPTEGQVPAYMEGVDRDTPVVMYCTGGIRCDIYSAYLREKGYDNVYALKGGVHGYFREQGGEGWNGSLFVFDGRMAVPAAKPDDAEAMLAAQSAADDTQDVSSPYAALPAAVPCQICGGERSNGAMAEAPPINCANIDCNKLVLACRACKEHLKCCCSENCLHNAPRMVRPAKPTGGNYGKWSRYAESDAVVTAGGIKSQEARARAAASGMGPLAGARGREPQANA